MGCVWYQSACLGIHCSVVCLVVHGVCLMLLGMFNRPLSGFNSWLDMFNGL